MVAVYGTLFISMSFFFFLHFGVDPFASFLPHFKFICIASYLFGAYNNRTGRLRVPCAEWNCLIFIQLSSLCFWHPSTDNLPLPFVLTPIPWFRLVPVDLVSCA